MTVFCVRNGHYDVFKELMGVRQCLYCWRLEENYAYIQHGEASYDQTL